MRFFGVSVETQALKKSHVYEWVLRFIYGGLISVAALLVAKRWGDGVGGLFLGFPSLLPASLSLVKSHDGTRKMIDDARGATLGAFALIAFAVVAHFLLPRWPLVPVLVVALVVWFGVSVALWKIVFRNDPS